MVSHYDVYQALGNLSVILPEQACRAAFQVLKDIQTFEYLQAAFQVY